jgi:AraC family transcriptional regulator, arabinose operon regulatory protein
MEYLYDLANPQRVKPVKTLEHVEIRSQFFLRNGPPAWPVDVRSIGKLVHREICNLPNGRPFFELSWTLQGAGRIEASGHEHRLAPGWLFILPPDLPHVYGPAAKEDPWWVPQWFTIDGANAKMFMRWLGLDKFWAGPLPGFPGERGQRLLDTVDRKGITGDLDRWESCMRALLEISARLSGKISESGRRFDSVMQWARNHMGPQMGVKAMAREAGLTRTYFSRVFTAETGMTPVAFLMETKLTTAKNLLLNSGKPVRQIAQESGFADASHFCRQFFAKTGLTPARYRRGTIR